MDRGDLGSRVISALLWSYGGAATRVLLQLAVQLLLARFLGPEAFGEATAAFFALSIGWQLAEAGFGAALVQKAEVTRADISFALGWVLLLSVSLAAVVIGFAPWIAVWLGNSDLTPLIIASGALIPVQAVSNIPVSLMRRNLDVKRSQFIYLGGYLIAYAVVALPMAWAGFGAWSLVAAFGVHSFINFAGSYAFVRHTLVPSLKGDKALLRFGLQVTGTSAANWAMENVDRLLVNRIWGTTALGAYTAAFNLSRAPAGLLINSVQSVAFASASRIQDDPARLGRAYVAMLSLVSLISWPVFALMAMHADAVVHLLYGDRWEQAGPLFAAFCAGLPCFAVLAVSGPLLWAIDAVKKDLMVQVAGASVLLLGFWALSGLPLAHAVWLVPFVFLFRMLWMYALLAAALKVEHASALKAVGGGLLLAVLAVAVSAAASLLLAPLLAMVGASALSALLAVLLVLRFPLWFVAAELQQLLIGRASGAGPIRRLCELLKLPTGLDQP